LRTPRGLDCLGGGLGKLGGLDFGEGRDSESLRMEVNDNAVCEEVNQISKHHYKTQRNRPKCIDMHTDRKSASKKCYDLH
jgi:hypothetical protein